MTFDGPCIYQITHVDSGRIYIGSAVCYRKRVLGHTWRLVQGTHHNPKLQNAWRKYGPDAFAWEVLEECSRDALRDKEQEYINRLKPWFNIATSVTAPMLGRKNTPETIAKRVASRGKVIVSQEQREKIASSLRGRQGKSPSEETRRRVSEKLKGHPVNREAMASVWASRVGTHRTDDERRRISEGLRRYHQTRKRAVQLELPL